jgi:hypothetical protein
MPLDGSADDIETDVEILEAVGRRYDDLTAGAIRSGALLRTLRRWVVGHVQAPDDPDEQACLMAMALDLELFTPSAAGSTPMGRYLRTARAEGDADARALEALRAARWRLVRIVGREAPGEVVLADLLGGERLRLLDVRISPLAVGLAAAMRLCPLASGRHVLVSPLFALDGADLAAAMNFARPGKGVGDGHRCAAALYRDAARRGFVPIPQIGQAMGLEDAVELSEAEALALKWLRGSSSPPDADLVAEIRRAASVHNLVDACGCFAQPGPPPGLASAFEAVARIQMETIAGRADAGVGGWVDALDQARREIAGYVAAGKMNPQARALFERLAAAAGASPGPSPAGEAAPGDTAELTRVLNLVQALRARTVERGCSEAEAMAAAAKLAELLARYDLTLDEVSVRRSDCEGVTVATGRRRRAPADACVPPIADFCDCRVWGEEAEDGALRYIYFGLRADVQGARLLHDLVDAAFESETAAFRAGATYRALRGGDRRMAANSFQVGLANGIVGKLEVIRRERAVGAKSGGFDLVALKHTVVDEEMERLGLRFTTRKTSSRRLVHEEAYLAGRAAGALFEPSAALRA